MKDKVFQKNILEPFEEHYKNLNQSYKAFGEGAFYQGPIDPSGNPHGWGRIINRNGSIVLGEFNQGEITHGRYILEDGSYYEGTLNKNNAAGNGFFIKDHLKY